VHTSTVNDPEFTSLIRSPVAEVKWWVDYMDTNNNYQRDAGEPYMLMRRALLVRPDIEIDESEGLALMIQESDDVSVADVGPPDAPRGIRFRNKMASLGDLSLRQHRYWHMNRYVHNQEIDLLYDFPYVPRCGSTRDSPSDLPERRADDLLLFLVTSCPSMYGFTTPWHRWL
jgi:hypothetical protein